MAASLESAKIRTADHEALSQIAKGMPGVTLADLITAARKAFESLPLRKQTVLIGQVVQETPTRGRPRTRRPASVAMPAPDPAPNSGYPTSAVGS